MSNTTESLNVPKNWSGIFINTRECNQHTGSLGKPKFHLFQCSCEGLGAKRREMWAEALYFSFIFSPVQSTLEAEGNEVGISYI